MINTILVEDDLYIQKHFVDRLAADGEFHLVGVFRDAFEAEKHCDATVKLVLMDVQTQHKHSGLAAAERIKKAFPQIKIVVATSLVDPEVLQRAKLGAADSLWYKDHGTEELMSVVKRTLAGEKVFPDIAPQVSAPGSGYNPLPPEAAALPVRYGSLPVRSRPVQAAAGSPGGSCFSCTQSDGSSHPSAM